MNRTLSAAVLALACAACSGHSLAATSGPPQSAVETTIRGLFPGTDLVKNTVEFHQIKVGPGRVAHTGEVYGLPGGTRYWNVLAQYTVHVRNNFDPANPQCTAQDSTQLFIAHKSDFGDWAISMVSGPENHSGDEHPAPCS